jgi:ATP-dependent Clp protease adapter protein ClpS
MSTATESNISTASILGNPYNVILFNDEEHDMVEVVWQIMKATSCAESRAHQIMMEAHATGRAIAYTGSKERCEHVESILCEIRLGTRIEPA